MNRSYQHALFRMWDEKIHFLNFFIIKLLVNKLFNSLF